MLNVKRTNCQHATTTNTETELICDFSFLHVEPIPTPKKLAQSSAWCEAKCACKKNMTGKTVRKSTTTHIHNRRTRATFPFQLFFFVCSRFDNVQAMSFMICLTIFPKFSPFSSCARTQKRPAGRKFSSSPRHGHFWFGKVSQTHRNSLRPPS